MFPPLSTRAVPVHPSTSSSFSLRKLLRFLYVGLPSVPTSKRRQGISGDSQYVFLLHTNLCEFPPTTEPHLELWRACGAGTWYLLPILIATLKTCWYLHDGGEFQRRLANSDKKVPHPPASPCPTQHETCNRQMTVGNATTTTVRGLVPGTLHAFWVRGLSEDRSDPAGEQVDLYGRRAPLPGAVTGYFGEISNLVATLEEDILFERCHCRKHNNAKPSSLRGLLGFPLYPVCNPAADRHMYHRDS